MATPILSLLWKAFAIILLVIPFYSCQIHIGCDFNEEWREGSVPESLCVDGILQVAKHSNVYMTGCFCKRGFVRIERNGICIPTYLCPSIDDQRSDGRWKSDDQSVVFDNFSTSVDSSVLTLNQLLNPWIESTYPFVDVLMDTGQIWDTWSKPELESEWDESWNPAVNSNPISDTLFRYDEPEEFTWDVVNFSWGEPGNPWGEVVAPWADEESAWDEIDYPYGTWDQWGEFGYDNPWDESIETNPTGILDEWGEFNYDNTIGNREQQIDQLFSTDWWIDDFNADLGDDAISFNNQMLKAPESSITVLDETVTIKPCDCINATEPFSPLPDELEIEKSNMMPNMETVNYKLEIPYTFNEPNLLTTEYDELLTSMNPWLEATYPIVDVLMDAGNKWDTSLEPKYNWMEETWNDLWNPPKNYDPIGDTMYSYDDPEKFSWGDVNFSWGEPGNPWGEVVAPWADGESAWDEVDYPYGIRDELGDYGYDNPWDYIGDDEWWEAVNNRWRVGHFFDVDPRKKRDVEEEKNPDEDVKNDERNSCPAGEVSRKGCDICVCKINNSTDSCTTDRSCQPGESSSDGGDFRCFPGDLYVLKEHVCVCNEDGRGVTCEYGVDSPCNGNNEVFEQRKGESYCNINGDDNIIALSDWSEYGCYCKQGYARNYLGDCVNTESCGSFTLR